MTPYLDFSTLDPKFQAEGVASHQPFFLSQDYGKQCFMRYKNVGTVFFRFVTNHAFDGQLDNFLVARPRLRYMQRRRRNSLSHFVRAVKFCSGYRGPDSPRHHPHQI